MGAAKKSAIARISPRHHLTGGAVSGILFNSDFILSCLSQRQEGYPDIFFRGDGR